MSDNNRCPICGDRYLTYHKKLDSEYREATLRDDATFCARSLESLKGKEQWVHVPLRNQSAGTDGDRNEREGETDE